MTRLTQTFAGHLTAAALVGTLTLSGFASAASAQSGGQDEPATEGSAVIFEYGRGIDEESVASAARVVTAQGCPTTYKGDGFFDGAVEVIIVNSGDSEVYEDPGDAAGWALDNCK